MACCLSDSPKGAVVSSEQSEPTKAVSLTNLHRFVFMSRHFLASPVDKMNISKIGLSCSSVIRHPFATRTISWALFRQWSKFYHLFGIDSPRNQNCEQTSFAVLRHYFYSLQFRNCLVLLVIYVLGILRSYILNMYSKYRRSGTLRRIAAELKRNHIKRRCKWSIVSF